MYDKSLPNRSKTSQQNTLLHNENSHQSLLLEIAGRSRESAHFVYTLRHDPEVEKNSLSQREAFKDASSVHAGKYGGKGVVESFDDFYALVWPSYFQIAELPPLFIRLKSERVGYISFRPTHCNAEKDGIEISIAIEKRVRNQGIGKLALEKAIEFAKEQRVIALEAYIFSENNPSIRLFEGVGFKFQGEVLYEKWSISGVKTVPILRYRLSLLEKEPSTFNLQAHRHTFIIAEIGSNWRLGDIENDLKLVEMYVRLAKEAGADAVKFQTFHPERLYAKGAGASSYLKNKGNSQEMSSLFTKLMMPHEAIGLIAGLCDDQGIEFMSTPFSEEDFDAVDPYVQRHKIASYELAHLPLLQKVKNAKKPLYLSTGASNIYEITWAMQQLQGVDVTLLQCTAAYPAVDSALNLASLKTLSHTFNVPVGLSDHSLDPFVAPVAAVALGAKVIEKHVTLDRRLPGPDHSFAITFEELGKMVASIRAIESMLGSRCKVPAAEELELYYFAKRRLQATKEIKKGEKVQLGVNCALLRPGNQRQGVHPSELPNILGKKVGRVIKEGEGITFESIT